MNNNFAIISSGYFAAQYIQEKAQPGDRVLIEMEVVEDQLRYEGLSRTDLKFISYSTDETVYWMFSTVHADAIMSEFLSTYDLVQLAEIDVRGWARQTFGILNEDLPEDDDPFAILGSTKIYIHSCIHPRITFLQNDQLKHLFLEKSEHNTFAILDSVRLMNNIPFQRDSDAEDLRQFFTARQITVIPPISLTS